MTNLYIVSTPYHLLISIIKTILANRIGKDIIVMYNFHLSPSTIKNAKKVFFKTYTCNYLNILLDLLCLKLKLSKVPFISKKVKNKFDESFFQAKEIYIFNDNSYFGCLFNHLKITYNLIEDGLNFFELDPFLTNVHSKLYDFFSLSWDCFGRSPYTKSIEVNDSDNICISYPNIVAINRKEMYKALSNDDIDLIAQIFDYQALNIPLKSDSSLLLTQPLSEDGIISHAKKIKLYKYLVKKYAIGTLYIKVHPREKDDYSKIFPNAIILGNKKTPFEVILLKEKLHFKRAISAFTKTMDAIYCADEKIQMGLDWTLNFDEKRTN